MTDDDITIFELRSYRILEGKRDAFAEHVREIRMPIYNRIGWRCDGFFSSDDEPMTVYYLLHWKSLEERVALRAVLAEDPEWVAWKNTNPEKLVDDFQFTLMTKVG